MASPVRYLYKLCCLASPKVVCNMEDDIMEFEVCLEELRDCIITHNGSKDVARHGSSGVAVTLMVDRGYYRFLKVVEILNRTIDSNSKSLFRNPTFTNCFDVIHIRCRRINKTESLVGQSSKLTDARTFIWIKREQRIVAFGQVSLEVILCGTVLLQYSVDNVCFQC